MWISSIKRIDRLTGDTAEAQIKVKGMVCPGTKICIGDVFRVVQKCKSVM